MAARSLLADRLYRVAAGGIHDTGGVRGLPTRPPLRVRDVSRLGTQSGWANQFCADAIGLRAIGVVRAARVFRRQQFERCPDWGATVKLERPEK